MAQIFPIDFEEKLTMAQDDYILFSDSEDGNKIKKAQYSNLKGEKGDTGTAATIAVGTVTTGAAGSSATVTNVGTSGAAVFDFSIPKGDKGDTGSAGAAATITVGSTTTGAAGTSASVTNSGTSSAAVLDFTIPKGDKGDTGSTGAAATISVGTTTTLDAGDNATVTNSGTSSAAVFNFGIPKGDTGDTGATGNGIASITSSKAGKTTTVTITETNGDDYSFQVEDGADGQGAGDVIGPASSTDGDIVLFNGATGKIIKDSGVGLSSKLDASALSDNNYGGAWNGDTTHTPTKNALYTKIHTMDVEIGNKAADLSVVKLTGNQTIAGTKTFSTSPVVPAKSTDAANSDTAIATEAQVYKKQDKLTTQTAYTSKGTSTKVPTITTNTLGQVTGITETSIAFPVTSVNGNTGAVTVSEFTPSGTATTGYVVTKTASGYEWKAPSGGDVMVSSQSGNILTSGMKIWAGTQSDYEGLGTYDNNTVYLTI